MNLEHALNIPEEMRQRNQWVNWASLTRPGKPAPTKVPINSKTGAYASATDPNTWSSFEDALSATPQYKGVGYVFIDDDPYVGIDLDACIRDGDLQPWAQTVVRSFNSYSEISISGTGAHIFAMGCLPEGGVRRKFGGDSVDGKQSAIEMYSTGRFFIVTGNVIPGVSRNIEKREEEILSLYSALTGGGKPPPPVVERAVNIKTIPEDRDLLLKAAGAKNGDKFYALYEGKWEGIYLSQSEADLALCRMLAFYCGPDAERIDRLFRRSGLMRDKWDDRRGVSTMGEITIEKALEAQTEFVGSTNAAEKSFVNSVNIVTARNKPVDEEWEAPVPLEDRALPEFPSDIFPGKVRKFVEAVANATQTPLDLSGMMTLAASAAAVQKKAEISPSNGWKEPLNLYCLTALEPATRKSAVTQTVCQPLLDYEKAEYLRRAPEVEAAQSHKRILEARLREAEAQASKGKDAQQRAKAEEEARSLAREVTSCAIPGDFRLVMEDCTPEALVTLMAANGGKMAVLSAEGDVLDIMGGRYSDKGPNLGVYLKAHAGESLVVDRISAGRQNLRVDKAALTLGLAVQPEVLRGVARQPGFRGRGMLGRFLYSLPVDNVGFREIHAPAIPRPVTSEYDLVVQTLLRMHELQDADGKPIPHLLTFARDASALFDQFRHRVEVELRPGGLLGDIRDWGGKLCGAVARVAGILHLLRIAEARGHPWNTVVTQETVVAAIRFGEYAIAHARAAFAEMNADAETGEARAILQWVQRSGKSHFRTNEAYRSLHRRFKKPADMEAPLGILVSRYWLRPVEAEYKGIGRKPTAEYEVNPLALEGENSVTKLTE